MLTRQLSRLADFCVGRHEVVDAIGSDSHAFRLLNEELRVTDLWHQYPLSVHLEDARIWVLGYGLQYLSGALQIACRWRECRVGQLDRLAV